MRDVTSLNARALQSPRAARTDDAISVRARAPSSRSVEAGTSLRVAYLVSQFPATSHTFIRREVEALRAQGIAVETFSVRRPSSEEAGSPLERAAFEKTHYLLPLAPLALLAAHGKALLERPRSYFRVFGLAMHHRVPGLRALIWAFFHFAEAIVLAHELERRGIEHLHNHFANAGANVGLLTSRYLQLPWSLTLHGVSETDYPAGLLLGAKIEAAQFVACASYFTRAQAMRAASPEHWHKLIIVRCALDLANLPRRATHEGTTPLHVICVGRLVAEKGHIGLLEALAIVRARGIDVRLVLVGDGPERDHIEERISALDLDDHVVLPGRLSEAETLVEIADADLLVLPSFIEGLPIVLMEAMALGVPVIAARVAGVPELVADEQQGLLFAPTDWVALADQMARLLTDSSLRNRLCKDARKKIETEFEIGRAVEPLAARFTQSPDQPQLNSATM